MTCAICGVRIRHVAKGTGRLVLIVLVWLVAAVLSPVGSASAASGDEAKWSGVNIPAEGQAGGWMLAQGSDIQHVTMAVDGTLYAYGKGLSYTLLKSVDDGYSWSGVGQVQGSIADIAVAPNDASLVYYATSSSVYKSADAGNSFIQLPSNPGGAGSNNVEITSIDVTYFGSYLVAVGTRDIDSGDYGGVYTLDEGTSFTWADSNVGNYDVYDVALSPNFPGDRKLLAAVTDETDTLVATRVADAAWGATVGNARLDRDNSGLPTPVAVAVSADIVFPDDYDAVTGSHTLFVAIDTGGGNGDVYRVSGTVAVDINVASTYGLSNIDISSLAVSGNTSAVHLLAGAADSAQVYFSSDGGLSWAKGTKPPTGQARSCVVMAADFASSGLAYVATSGEDSAFSYTADGGTIWNQLSLIDTRVSDILDLAPSANYDQDGTLFMVTWGGQHSLWRSRSGGARWERVYAGSVADVDSISRVALSPHYGDNSQVVFLAGRIGGSPAIWRSMDGGQSFSSPWFTYDPITGVGFPIDVWVVVDDNTLFVGSYNGSQAMVYGSTNGGWTYSTAAAAGSQQLNSMAVSPGYDQDGAILVGNTSGGVYWSDQSGRAFVPLPASPPLAGNVSVAFDPQFASNHTVYAAGGSQNEGIYRFVIGTSASWVNIDSALPTGAMVGGLRVSTDGVLYATNFKVDGGMERCLVPSSPLGPRFETVVRGLADGATLTGLWLCQNRLWSVDSAHTRLLTYSDSLALPLGLLSPPDGASGVGTIVNYQIDDVVLDWEALNGATEYQWQLDHEDDFSSVPAGFEGKVNSTSAELPPLKPAITYYWRVRATQPVLSPWSSKWLFTTSLGSETAAPALICPEAGAGNVELKPIFQWSSVVGADKYELLVSSEVSFTNPLVARLGSQALPATAWQCDASLDNDTTYYWKVRAIGSGTSSAWSVVGAFTTCVSSQTHLSSTAELPPSGEVASSSPMPASSRQDTPDWAKWLMYLGSALLMITLAILITLVVLAVRMRRL